MLEGTELDAAVNVLDGVIEREIGLGKFVGGEEVFHIVAVAGGAELADGAHHDRTHSCGELCLDIIPIIFDVVPRLRTGLLVQEGGGELNGRVLVADLAGGGVVEGTLDESGILEIGEETQSVVLDGGIGRGLGELCNPSNSAASPLRAAMASALRLSVGSRAAGSAR